MWVSSRKYITKKLRLLQVRTWNQIFAQSFNHEFGVGDRFRILMWSDREEYFSVSTFVYFVSCFWLNVSQIASLFTGNQNEVDRCCLTATCSLHLLIEHAQIWGSVENGNAQFTELRRQLIDAVTRLADHVIKIIQVINRAAIVIRMECFHSNDQWAWFSSETKVNVCIWIEFNSQMIT